ncbi:hypothetical protein NP233_g11636 [Leucocoprinus birnbaumii]|uniref:Uncharacterized protein n=1 Tax=Leucocoprinus birnbaumii TaxID=56174 RepID=A0AAD5YQR6_9AGAR|nr:hypothetical protein NP233_g11636 [Leucocoprinus birnbaumii]
MEHRVEDTPPHARHDYGNTIHYYIQGDQSNDCYDASIKVEGVGNTVNVTVIHPVKKMKKRRGIRRAHAGRKSTIH